jgi:hypothetical protein
MAGVAASPDDARVHDRVEARRAQGWGGGGGGVGRGGGGPPPPSPPPWRAWMRKPNGTP